MCPQAEEISATRRSMSALGDERDSLRAQFGQLEESHAGMQQQAVRLQGENAQLLLDLHAFEQQNEVSSAKM